MNNIKDKTMYTYSLLQQMSNMKLIDESTDRHTVLYVNQ